MSFTVLEPENLKVCATGWQHTQWINHFYPEGMPEEWYLEFYATQFPYVLVPESVWSLWTSEYLESMLESIEGDEFALVLELSTAIEKWQGQVGLIQRVLGSHVYGLYIHGSTCPDDSNQLLSYQTLIEHWQKMGLRMTWELAQDEVPHEVVTKCEKERQLSEWQWSHEGRVFFGAPVIVLDMTAKPLSILKSVLSAYVDGLPQHTQGALVFARPGINADRLKDIQVMVELMGF